MQHDDLVERVRAANAALEAAERNRADAFRFERSGHVKQAAEARGRATVYWDNAKRLLDGEAPLTGRAFYEAARAAAVPILPEGRAARRLKRLQLYGTGQGNV